MSSNLLICCHSCVLMRQYSHRYIAPLISKRVAAMFRKRAIAAGTYGTFDPVCGAKCSLTPETTTDIND